MAKTKTAVCVGDLHFPYADIEVVKRIIQIIKEQQPDYVVQMGDLYDFFHFSKYPKSMRDFSPEEEVSTGRKQAEAFWEAVQSVSPKSKCFQLVGNHDVRPMKRLLEKAPELEVFFSVNDMFDFEGVAVADTDRQELVLNVFGQDVMFMHGYRSQPGSHMAYNEMSTVVGHSHTGGVVYKNFAKNTRWELNAGYAANPKAGPLQYGNQTKKYWTHGVGVIDEMGPRFIPIRVR